MRSSALLSAGLLLLLAPTLRAESIKFNRDIRPILSENCFACHGPDKNARQAELRLDRRDEAVARGAINPSDAAGSKLVARIRADQEMLRMPPVWSDKKLTSEQQQTLVDWIEQGAQYEAHWAYLPPERPESPAGAEAIDFFIGKGLDEKDLSPVDEADRRMLARRLSFDLLGLPPEPEVVEAFVEDRRPEAYKKLLDGLLASRHFGERMAVHWLDLVRYADTVGFHGDVAVNVYPFRDYVIRSFNENKPFDEFTREQIGGDLIPGAGVDQLVASAYNRLSRMTNEGGSQAKEYLAKYAADRVRTTSTVWLGSTLGCAECHDHKFDPFATKDFYAMQAFFADIKEEGVFSGFGDWGSKIQVPSREARKTIASIDKRIEVLGDEGRGKLEASDGNLRDFAARLRSNLESWTLVEPSSVTNDCSDPNVEGCDSFELPSEGGVIRLREKSELKTLTVVEKAELPLDKGRVTSLMIEVLEVENSMDFFLAEFEVSLLREGEPARSIPIKTFLPDWESDGVMLRSTIDGNHHTGWGGRPCEEGVRRAVFVLEEAIDAQAGDRLEVTTIFDRIFGLKGFALRHRLWAGNADFPELPPPDELRSAVSAVGDWSEAERRRLAGAFAQATEHNANYLAIQDLERQKKTLIDSADQCLVTKAVGPREIRILPRGNWMDTSGEVVEPQAPHFLPAIPSTGKRLTRLELADWLVDRKNPLTARVFVNRLWKMFFGTGLSKVLDDIGSQGEPPVNQELLDWLAVEFMESGWDVKHTIRAMLLSKAYRRASEPSEALEQADPSNRLHGRQTARRLEAEFIRDNALKVSGLLNDEIGGRSAKPYQPADYYIELNFPKRRYHADFNENQFRRGLYVHWQRTYLHPAMMAFDAPSREECAADRPVSNTPLQALTLLNDPTFVEAAKAFGARILGSGASVDAERLDFAFQEAFSRKADPREQEVLLELLEQQRQYFEADRSQAAELLETGISKVPPDLETTELAAWTTVARALLNKHEFVMRY